VNTELTKRAGEAVKPTARGGYRGIASSGDVDCAGDRMLSWKFPASGRVPLLVGHDPAVPIGDAMLTVEGDVLVAELLFPPSGTSVATDEARRLVEAGVARLSIGFGRDSKGKANELGGVDWNPANVIEVSIVGAGCLSAAGVPHGKCAGTCACGAKPETRYLVDPATVAELLPKAIAAEFRKQLCAAAGRLDSTDEDLAHVLKGIRQHRAEPGLPAGLARFFAAAGREDRPEPAELGPSRLAVLEDAQERARGAHAVKQLQDQAREGNELLSSYLRR